MMNIEIERKFLVDKDQWKALVKPAGVLVRQGYLLAEPERTIRVRMIGQQGFLTIKSKSVGIRRNEFEYEIPGDEAKELLEHFSIAAISKLRHKITYRKKTWEVDEFLDENEGLIMAEIELLSENESFDIPNWITKEVTGDTRYYNSNLSINPYKNWKE